MSPMPATCPAHLIFIVFVILMIFRGRVQITELLSCILLQPHATSSVPRGPHILLSKHPVPKHPLPEFHGTGEVRSVPVSPCCPSARWWVSVAEIAWTAQMRPAAPWVYYLQRQRSGSCLFCRVTDCAEEEEREVRHTVPTIFCLLFKLIHLWFI
jgi:hypothetical protein